MRFKIKRIVTRIRGKLASHLVPLLHCGNTCIVLFTYALPSLNAGKFSYLSIKCTLNELFKIRGGCWGQSKSSRDSLPSRVWCARSSYRLDRVLLCKFCRRSGSTSGRKGQWFLHRATHRLLCHHPATVLSGPLSE
jgi:hypothetical protein